MNEAAFAELLAGSGSSMSASEVHDLIEGVAAAPEARESDAWMTLVADAPSDALRGVLAELIGAARTRFAEDVSSPAPPDRLECLRVNLREMGLDGFVVPRADAHQGEWVPRAAERLAWLTGFAGSAGVAIVLLDRAAVFIDGRYTLQVRSQVDTTLFKPCHLIEEPPTKWLSDNLAPGQKLGFDPWLHTSAGAQRLRDSCEKVGATLVPCAVNPLDAIWLDQPPPPISPVVPHDIRYAGRSAAEKRGEIAESLRQDGLSAALVSAPDSIAWLFNIRGGDVGHTPLPLGFAVIDDGGQASLFMDPRKVPSATRAHLGNAVTVEPVDALTARFEKFAGKKVRIDQATGADWLAEKIRSAGAVVAPGDDPCALPKACKNQVELNGMRTAHCRDGIALTRFLAWLESEATTGRLTEIAASDRLEALRREDPLFRDLSFPTIAGSGPNGAIVHYRATPDSDRTLRPGDLFLLDSGAQYLDGTTDVTRTVLIGAPNPDLVREQRDRFTRVLKGHIAIARARFPKGTQGPQLDALARLPLWEAGTDFDHGTGHGVGSYLGVHEGPQRISKGAGGVALHPGMVISNEPGYYREGAYGIRIENLVAVVPVDNDQAKPSEREMYEFETLTLAPIDRKLIDVRLLSGEELSWINAYHLRIREEMMGVLDAETMAWVRGVTDPLKREPFSED